MINLSTKSKFLIGSFLSKILIFFYGDKKRIVTRNGLNYEIDFKEGVDLGIFFGIKNENNLYKITNYLDINKKSFSWYRSKYRFSNTSISSVISFI